MSHYTVNGRPWAECLQEIRKYKKKTKQKEAGNGKSYGYFNIDEYIQRLDEVIGTDHYMVETGDFDLIRMDSGQEMMIVRCKISILDDEGRVIISKSAYGGTEIQYAKATGRDSGIGNAPGNACKDAFKAAAELFGILGYHGYKAEDEARTGALPAGTGAKGEGVLPHKEQKDLSMNLVSEGAFFDAGERNGRTVWKLSAHEKVNDSQLKAEVCEVIFYPNQYGKEAKKFNDFYAEVAKRPVPFRVLVQSCGKREGRPQYIFKGFTQA